jgi:hypothetical protein
MPTRQQSLIILPKRHFRNVLPTPFRLQYWTESLSFTLLWFMITWKLSIISLFKYVMKCHVWPIYVFRKSTEGIVDRCYNLYSNKLGSVFIAYICFNFLENRETRNVCWTQNLYFRFLWNLCFKIFLFCSDKYLMSYAQVPVDLQKYI